MTTLAHQLIDAINRNDITTASSLISSGGVNLNGDPWPLHIAARHGRLEIITLVLDGGADIDLWDYFRRTACHMAIYYDQFDALKLLVERGVNPNANAESLLVCATKRCRGDRFLIVLLDAGASIDTLTCSELMSLVRSVAVFKRLLTRGVNFDAMRDEFGSSLCHHVARRITDTAENDLCLLVEACAFAVNAVNDDGQTPLHQAARNHNRAAMRMLVELGTNIDQQDNLGWTALHIVIAASQVDASLDVLLALGADVRLVTNRGVSAFFLALREGNKAGFCLLIAAGGGGVDLDQPYDKGETLYMIAARYNVRLPTTDEIDDARRRIAKTRLDLVRRRAVEICIGLQQLDLNALQLCQIMMHSFGAIGSLIPFHQWWAIATKVKHFHNNKR